MGVQFIFMHILNMKTILNKDFLNENVHEHVCVILSCQAYVFSQLSIIKNKRRPLVQCYGEFLIPSSLSFHKELID